MEMAYIRLRHNSEGAWRDVSVTGSHTAQREERVNQGENGNPLALVTHERERIGTFGIQAGASRAVRSATLHLGFDRYIDRIAAPSWGWDPAREHTFARRGRIPDGAKYAATGAFAHSDWDLRFLRLTAALRWNDYRYGVEA
jgi:hypothetical protein